MAKMNEQPLKDILGVDIPLRNKERLKESLSDNSEDSESMLDWLVTGKMSRKNVLRQNSWQSGLLRSVFKGQTVVDLGAGETSLGYALALLGSAKSYIGVEPYHKEELRQNLINEGYRTYDLFKELKLIPFALSDLDMLSFLEVLENKSVSMITVGIEYCIANRSYMMKVEKEIQRTLSKDRGILEYVSDFSFPSNWTLKSLWNQNSKVKPSDRRKINPKPCIVCR